MRRPVSVNRHFRVLDSRSFCAFRGRPTGGASRRPLSVAPFPSSQSSLQNGGICQGRAAFARLANPCLMPAILEPGARGKGAGVSGACSLAEFEAAPHARPRRAAHQPIPSFVLDHLFETVFRRLTPAPCRLASIRTLFWTVATVPIGVLNSRVLLSLCRSEGSLSPGSLRSAATSQSTQTRRFRMSAESSSSSILMPLLWPCPCPCRRLCRLTVV